jgi:hypothetical protein
MGMGKKQQVAHKEFLNLHPEFKPVEVYKALCKLVKVGEDAIHSGIGKLFAEGKLKSQEKRPKVGKRKSRPADEF